MTQERDVVPEPGDRVRHRSKADWGVGVVREIARGRIKVFFEYGGAVTIAGPEYLVAVTGREAASPRLDNLAAGGGKRQQRGAPVAPALLMQRFLTRYPDGFRDPLYLEEERNHKVAASTLATQLIGPEPMAGLIRKKNHAEICRRAVEVLRATNLLHPAHEVPRVVRAVATPAHAAAFAEALAALARTPAAEESAFTGFADVLDRLRVMTWPLATYFPLLLAPQVNAFMRPTEVQAAAQAVGFEIYYEPRPNWRTYQAVLRLMQCIRDEIRELNPSDMIDVQSFVWLTMRAD